MTDDDGARRVDIVHRPGDPPSEALRVRVGDEIAVTLHGSPAYGWTPVEVTEGPLAVVEAHATEGTVHATFRATAAGVAGLRSTSSFRGDRFGPRTRLWRLQVHVDQS
ncbi:hypothetical protein [Streptomyces roseochromogenus]|uniref:Proteinase inhibitor I42 chagasin domain-containing protein n=1 Tax=Streptomyces roseochromogenus subsp. oscitans DS 12.976 TaxID=1352936 RepID=V6KUT9_STRRC|nr:hypothetical protein [Streptomyces roseochromogenus]EST35161.1 hypothetical protein M878_07235 [Streptomyces roseochromogenus subsp. oscitans DS 12.976]